MQSDIQMMESNALYAKTQVRENENKKSILSTISQKREKHKNIISSGVNIFSKNENFDKSSKG